MISVAGAFVLAFLLETLVRRRTPDHWLGLLVGVGVLGAFTTFSTMATELALLWRDGDRLLALGYATASVTAGIVVGLALAHGLDPDVRTVVGTGFLGAYTTFSTYAYETVRCAGAGHTRVAVGYAIGSVVAATLAAVAGLVVTSEW